MGLKINPSWGYIPFHVVSKGRYHVTWFLMVDEILIFEDDKTNLNHLVGAADQTKELFFFIRI